MAASDGGRTLMPAAVYGSAHGRLADCAAPVATLAYPGLDARAAARRLHRRLRALQLGPLLILGVLYARRVRTLAADDHPVPGWRQACFYGGFVVIGAALTSLGAASQDLLYVHMIEHLLLGDIAALLIVLGLTGPLLAPILRIRLVRPPARADAPARRVPAVGDQPVRLAPARALPGGAAPLRRARARARDVPRLRDRHVDVPVRPAADPELVRQPRQADLHRRRAPHGHRARQHLPVVRARSSTRST